MHNFFFAKFSWILILLMISEVISAAVLDAGGGMTCGIQADNTVVCWGDGGPPPSGTFYQVSAGSKYACGVRTDNSVVCWGNDNDGQATPPSGTFYQVSAAADGNHTCGIKTNNTVVCWGSNSDGQATPPPGTFSQISTGWRHTCGILTDSTVACWGLNNNSTRPEWDDLPNGPVIPPNGTFSQISATIRRNCGVMTDGTPVCWDKLPDRYTFGDGGNTPPPGTFLQAGSGHYWSCWLRTDNAVVCRGAGDMPAAEAVRPPSSTCIGKIGDEPGTVCESPSGLFYNISAGPSHACGIRNDNTVVCWGGDRSAQTLPPVGFIVKSSDPEACLLYGVHDDGNNTQFFIINSGTSEVHARGKDENYKDESYKIDALDIQPLNNQLYAASNDNTSKKGHLYQVRNGAKILTEFGETDFREINGIAFHPDGMLWGWAQDAGLFQIGNGENNEPDLNAVKVVLPYNREDGVVEVEVNDLTWNTAGTILYGIGRVLHQDPSVRGTLNPENRLWVYDATEGTVSTACDNIMDSLDKVEALETLLGDSLLLGFTRNEKLIFLEIDVQTCEVMTQKDISTPYHDVKGLARPDCSHPYVDTGPSTK